MAEEITNQILLQHIQAGKEELKGEIQRIDKELKSEIGHLAKRMERVEQDIGELKRNDEKTHQALQRLYDRRIETVEKLEDHEKRIVTIEKELATAA